MAGGPKQFGIDAEQMPSILSELDVDKLDFQGFHISPDLRISKRSL